MPRTNINDLAQQRFIGTPKLLLYGEKYKNLSGNAFKTYVALYDRFTLSIKNNWIDEDNNVYFVYDLKELEEITCIKENALRTARKQLKNIGLIEEVSTGRNNRIYLSLPIPKDEEEAKFIITEQNSEGLKDTSKLTEEEKQKIAENLKGNKNSRKSDDTGKSSIAVKKPSNQHFNNVENQTILENQVSEPSKSSTNDTELNEPNKDFKDFKDSNYDSQLSLIENNLQKSTKENTMQEELINELIDNQGLVSLYGYKIIDTIKLYSFSDYDTFKTYIDKLIYAHRSVEKDLDITFALDTAITPSAEAMQNELKKAFIRAIQQYKAGNVENINNYLFGVFKKTFMNFGKQIEKEREETNSDKVSMVNWLE